MRTNVPIAGSQGYFNPDKISLRFMLALSEDKNAPPRARLKRVDIGPSVYAGLQMPPHTRQEVGRAGCSAKRPEYTHTKDTGGAVKRSLRIWMMLHPDKLELLRTCSLRKAARAWCDDTDFAIAPNESSNGLPF